VTKVRIVEIEFDVEFATAENREGSLQIGSACLESPQMRVVAGTGWLVGGTVT
jgi:hypothetical protein